MKQLYYTSCRLGHSVNGQSGFQVRARTPGLEGQQLQAAVSLAGYRLPEGYKATEETVSQAPVRLALLAPPSLGRVLLHSVYVGREGQGTRFGNFFSHLLLGVPAEVSPVRAINLWGSSLWQRADGDFGKDLPEFATDRLVAPSQSLLAPKKLLASETGKQMLHFLLTALLLPEHTGRRIILAAPADDVACCLLLALNILPRGFTRDLTFSTYEYAPLTCTARVIGADVSANLPESCYVDSCRAFHSQAGKKSDLGGTHPYAEQAFKDFPAKFAGLRDIAKWCDDHRVHTPELITAAYKYFTSQASQLTSEQLTKCLENEPFGLALLSKKEVIDKLTQDHYRQILKTRTLTDALFKHAVALETVVGWGCNDAEFHRLDLPAVLSYLKANPDSTDKLDLIQDNRDKLEAWLFLSGWEKEPALDEDSLIRAGEALALTPKPARTGRLDVITKALRQALDADSRQDLYQVLEVALENLYRDQPNEIHGRLCDAYARDVVRRPPRPAPLLAVLRLGFGVCQSKSLAEKLGEPAAEAAEALLRGLKGRRAIGLRKVVRKTAEEWNGKAQARVRQILKPPLWLRLAKTWWFWVVLVSVAAGVSLVVARPQLSKLMEHIGH